MPATVSESEIVRVKESYSHWLFHGNCFCQRLYLSFTPNLSVMGSFFLHSFFNTQVWLLCTVWTWRYKTNTNNQDKIPEKIQIMGNKGKALLGYLSSLLCDKW